MRGNLLWKLNLWVLESKKKITSSHPNKPTNKATNEPLTFAAVHLVTKILKLIVRSCCVLVKHERAEQKQLTWLAFFPHVLAGSLWKVPTNTHKNRKRHKFLPCKHLIRSIYMELYSISFKRNDGSWQVPCIQKKLPGLTLILIQKDLLFGGFFWSKHRLT